MNLKFEVGSIDSDTEYYSYETSTVPISLFYKRDTNCLGVIMLEQMDHERFSRFVFQLWDCSTIEEGFLHGAAADIQPKTVKFALDRRVNHYEVNVSHTGPLTLVATSSSVNIYRIHRHSGNTTDVQISLEGMLQLTYHASFCIQSVDLNSSQEILAFGTTRIYLWDVINGVELCHATDYSQGTGRGCIRFAPYPNLLFTLGKLVLKLWAISYEATSSAHLQPLRVFTCDTLPPMKGIVGVSKDTVVVKTHSRLRVFDFGSPIPAKRTFSVPLLFANSYCSKAIKKAKSKPFVSILYLRASKYSSSKGHS